jgi:hypothetical protein
MQNIIIIKNVIRLVMLSEKNLLIWILETEDIEINFKQKALEAMNVDNVFSLKDYVKKYNISMNVDIAKSTEENKEKLFYLLNEEFFKIRDQRYV